MGFALVDLGELGRGVAEWDFPEEVEEADAPVAVHPEGCPRVGDAGGEEGVAGPMCAEVDASEHDEGNEWPDEEAESAVVGGEEDCGDDGVCGVCGWEGREVVGDSLIEEVGDGSEEIGIVESWSGASDEALHEVEEEGAGGCAEDPVECAADSGWLEQGDDEDDDDDGTDAAELMEGLYLALEVAGEVEGAEGIRDGLVEGEDCGGEERAEGDGEDDAREPGNGWQGVACLGGGVCRVVRHGHKVRCVEWEMRGMFSVRVRSMD